MGRTGRPRWVRKLLCALGFHPVWVWRPEGAPGYDARNTAGSPPADAWCPECGRTYGGGRRG